MLMDPTECNYEGWTWYSSLDCTNTQPPTTWCTIENGTGKEITNYGKRWTTYWEAVASDINWVDICNPMPAALSSCANTFDTCKKNNTTKVYLECERYDLWTKSCVVDTCDPWYVQDWNKCVAWPIKWVCSTTSQSCTTWNYVDLTDTSTAYKWQCSGLNGWENTACSLPIPVTPVAGVCSTTHYSCDLWSSINNVNDSTQWTWDCQWTNGWATTSCTEDKDLTVVPPTVSWDWTTVWATSSANDDSKFAWMSNETKYVLEWCTPHKIELDGTPTWKCIQTYFTNFSWKALFPIDWWDWSNLMTSIVDNAEFEIKGEGVLYIKSFAKDYADNISEKQFIYKIDKTAPRFWDLVFTEIADGQYINVENYDISEDGQPNSLWVRHMSTQDDGKTFPQTNTYTKTSPTENAFVQNISDIKKIRYKQTGLASKNPIINVALSWATDTFGWTAHFNYVSRANKIEYYKWNSLDQNDATAYYIWKDIDLTKIITDQKNKDLSTFEFSKSGSPSAELTWNDGTFINVRLTDNAWNYSEKAFYVYRDEAIPIVWDIKLDFQWDTNNLRLPGKTDSRYVLANNTTNIDYDWGTANDHMATWIDMYVENINQNSIDNSNLSLSQKLSVWSDTSWTTTENINLTKIDTDLKNPAIGENYRNYEVQFRTPGISWNKICDAVGNCIDWNTVLTNFRAIANNINLSKSNLSIVSPINAFAWNYRTLWATWYNLTYSLKDVYDNTIRQIFADWTQIRKHVSNIEFNNGLNQKQIDLDYTNIWLSFGSNSYSWAVIVRDSEWSELIENLNNVNEVDLNTNLVLSEENNSSNWVFKNIIYSAIPTVWGYKYMKDSAVLTLEKINNNITDNNSLVYNGLSNSNDINIDYSWWANWNYYSITNNIDENVNNRYNLTNNSLTDYWKISPINYSKNLISPSDKINFEFWSPIVYYANNFNILRDGIDSEYLKKFKTNFTGTYKMYERYFDAWITLGSSYDINDNRNVDFYVDIQNNPTILDNKFMNFQEEATLANNSYNVQYQAKAGKDFEKWWYVSYIRYLVDWEWMHIPSISRWIAASGNNLQASAYYPTWITASGWVSHLTQDLAITWLVNKADGLSNTWPQVWLAQLDLERPYTRAELLSKLKKKIFSVNKVDNWCSNNVTDLTETPTSGANTCTFNINWEIISFYKWDLVIQNTNTITEKRTIIVVDGRVTIKSNINTDNNGQVLIASVTDKWLQNIDLSNDFSNLSKQKWWMAIGQNVTNINAFLLAQWPIVSLDNSLNNDVMHTYNAADKLLNQLHIYGSVFSLNTIWWENKNECPYIENTCDWDEAKMYDLSFLRRYALIDAGQFQWTQGVMVPYHPNLDFNSSNDSISKSSWAYSYEWNWNKVQANTGLREAKNEHLSAPVIVERDNKWTTSPSYFSKD